MGTPVPLLHTRGSAVPKTALFSGGVAPREVPLTVSPPSGCGSTAYRGVRGATSASTCTTSPSGAQQSCGSLVLAGTHSPHCPVPPCSYLHWQRGCHSAAHALLSPAQRAALPPHPHQDKQLAGSVCTGSSGGHRALHQHAVSPAMGTQSLNMVPASSCPTPYSPATPLPGMWWHPWGQS